jgi:ribosome maturation factor RimP
LKKFSTMTAVLDPLTPSKFLQQVSVVHLKQLRQYVKNVGRFIEIRYLPQEKVKGTLAEVQNELIVVTFEEKIKEGKKNKKVVRRIEIPFDQIIEAKIKLIYK